MSGGRLLRGRARARSSARPSAARPPHRAKPATPPCLSCQLVTTPTNCAASGCRGTDKADRGARDATSGPPLPRAGSTPPRPARSGCARMHTCQPCYHGVRPHGLALSPSDSLRLGPSGTACHLVARPGRELGRLVEQAMWRAEADLTSDGDCSDGFVRQDGAKVGCSLTDISEAPHTPA